MAKSTILNSVEEVIEDFRNGKIVIVVDDEDRENEGDFIVAAEKITPEIVNFMLKEGRGVLCAPLSEDRCAELGLNMMEENNTSLLGTPFTVTVDLLGHDCTTGVSIHDRAATIRALADPATRATDLGRPGHINPLRARQKGVLRRPGHTEAAIDLARLAGLQPAGALIEIMNEDGTMARLPQLIEIAKKFDLKIISIASLISYRLKEESIVEKGETVDLPTAWGDFRITPFRQKSNGLEHVALTKGEWTEDEPVLTRVHSSCATGDIFGSCRCDCGAQLHEAMRMIEKEGKGAVVYGRDIVVGLPVEREIPTDLINSCLEEHFNTIIDSVKVILERTPPELGADIFKHGVYLTGGASQTSHFAELLQKSTGLKVNQAQRPLESVVLGMGRILKEDNYKSVAYAIEGMGK